VNPFVRNRACFNNQIFLKILQTANCAKSKKQVIAKLFVYILTGDYNNSKTLKRKSKFEALAEIVVRIWTSFNIQISLERYNMNNNLKTFKKKTKSLNLVDIVARNRTYSNNQISLKTLQYEKTASCLRLKNKRQ